jgi:hypothetical protein
VCLRKIKTKSVIQTSFIPVRSFLFLTTDLKTEENSLHGS